MLAQSNVTREKNSPEEIRKVTVWDIILVIVFITSATAFIPVFYINQPARIVIYKDNTVYAEYQLQPDREITIKGHEGDMNLKVYNGEVKIESSTCKEQICVKSGKIGRPFQQLICAPNHVLVEIRSPKADRDVDAITR